MCNVLGKMVKNGELMNVAIGVRSEVLVVYGT